MTFRQANLKVEEVVEQVCWLDELKKGWNLLPCSSAQPVESALVRTPIGIGVEVAMHCLVIPGVGIPNLNAFPMTARSESRRARVRIQHYGALV